MGKINKEAAKEIARKFLKDDDPDWEYNYAKEYKGAHAFFAVYVNKNTPTWGLPVGILVDISTGKARYTTQEEWDEIIDSIADRPDTVVMDTRTF